MGDVWEELLESILGWDGLDQFYIWCKTSRNQIVGGQSF